MRCQFAGAFFLLQHVACVWHHAGQASVAAFVGPAYEAAVHRFRGLMPVLNNKTNDIHSLEEYVCVFPLSKGTHHLTSVFPVDASANGR